MFETIKQTPFHATTVRKPEIQRGPANNTPFNLDERCHLNISKTIHNLISDIYIIIYILFI